MLGHYTTALLFVAHLSGPATSTILKPTNVMDEMIDHHAIGRRLEAIRKKHRLPEHAMASRLALSMQSYRAYAQGRRQLPITLLHALRRDFGADLDWLVMGDGRLPSGV